MSNTPRTDKFFEENRHCFNPHAKSDALDFMCQLERELAVALVTLELWRDRAFDANAGEEFVEIDSLLGELRGMRRDYEEGT
jgi:hypothetical protein